MGTHGQDKGDAGLYILVSGNTPSIALHGHTLQYRIGNGDAAKSRKEVRGAKGRNQIGAAHRLWGIQDTKRGGVVGPTK